jgi:hypothetical protein
MGGEFPYEVYESRRFLWFGYGFLIMGIPSVLDSFAIEALRSKENASPAVCAVFVGRHPTRLLRIMIGIGEIQGLDPEL